MSVWATTIISGLVFVVAFMQWRTAHQKIVLDLFDRRLAVYGTIRQALSGVNATGLVTDETQRLLLEAESEAAFLFGPDIQQYIQDLWLLCTKYRAQFPRKGNPGPDFASAHTALMAEIGLFYQTGVDRFAPYMKMDHRRVPTPAEWLAERNRIRMSYADEKQK
jgi:hypothetical protein